MYIHRYISIYTYIYVCVCKLAYVHTCTVCITEDILIYCSEKLCELPPPGAPPWDPWRKCPVTVSIPH